MKAVQGFHLTAYRIINPLANPATLNRYPVLYGHGVFYDSANMISRADNSRPRKPVLGQPTINYGNLQDNSNDYSLPFALSNNNFDVWMFDSRGTNLKNRNSSHLTDLVQADKFWDFSIDDQALHDFPLMINFVLRKTGAPKLVYVGYSQSTLFVFELLSSKPEYSDKFVAIVALAPIAYVSHSKGLGVSLLTPLGFLLPEFLHYDYLPQPFIDMVDAAIEALCKVPLTSNKICSLIDQLIGGPGSGQYTPNFFAKFFKSTSLKVVKQFGQMFIFRRMSMYDYGPIENMRRYGQKDPPKYDLSNIRSDRIILCRGGGDVLSDPEDQETLIKELGTKPYRDIIIPNYNHFDFIDGKDLIRLVNEPVLKAIYELMYKEGANILKDFPQSSSVGGQLAHFQPTDAAPFAPFFLPPPTFAPDFQFWPGQDGFVPAQAG